MALLSLAALGGLRRPRLAISAAHGEPRLLVHGLRHVKSFGPADITQVRVTRQRRVGRRTALLEVDVIDGAAERLLIFSRWDLGTDPDDVLAAMSEYHLVPPTR